MTYYAICKKGNTDWKTRTTAVFEDMKKAEKYIASLNRDKGYNCFCVRTF